MNSLINHFLTTMFFSVFLLQLSLAIATIIPPGPDGKYTLNSIGISAKFIPYSAAVTNLYVSDRRDIIRDIVLGYDNASYYAVDPFHPNFGAVPGRYANRIANATYSLDGKRYFTDRNNGNSTIHSGVNGWSYRVWNVSRVTSDSITFTMRDENNSSMGMPGMVLGSVTYTLTPYAWRIKLTASAPTHDTPIMATNHAYWNLDAFANPSDVTILNHTLSLPFSKRMIGYDASAQADGTLPNVQRGSVNDFFSTPRHVGASISDPAWIGNCGKLANCSGYDNQWIVDQNDTSYAKPVASLWSDWSGIKWEMYSNQAGIVVFSCYYMPGK